MSDKSLFDAIDTEEIAGQKDAASRSEGPEPEKVASTAHVEVVEQAPQPSFIEPKADLIVGATGSGKTTNIGEVSDYVLKKYGKLTRMIGADSGGYGPVKGLVDSGQIEYWPIFAWPKQIDAMKKACHGYWPLRLDDPTSPIVPPDAGTYEVYGFSAYEGLTSFGDTILNSLGDDQAKLSQSPSYIYTQGDSTFSGGNESYYGFMQKELNRFVMYTNLLRFEKILWTGLESKGKDKDGNWVYGPMIGGKQATGKAGAWFCNFFHMDILAGPPIKDVDTGQQLVKARHVLFLKTHIDPLTLIPFPCKIRPPKAYAKDIPDYIESGSIAEAYKLLDTMYEKQAKESDGKLNEIAGLRDRLLERAGRARLAEQAAAEKRAKAANLLKPMVTVAGMPPVGAGKPVDVRSAGSAGTVPLAIPRPAGPVAPVPAPSQPITGVPVIQNVRKKEK